MPQYYIFEGHEPTRQGLTSEGDEAHIAGIAVWPRGQVREVTDDQAEFLDQTRCFTRVDGYPENGIPSADARGVIHPAYLPSPRAESSDEGEEPETTEAVSVSLTDDSDSAAAPAAPQKPRRRRTTNTN